MERKRFKRIYVRLCNNYNIGNTARKWDDTRWRVLLFEVKNDDQILSLKITACKSGLDFSGPKYLGPEAAEGGRTLDGLYFGNIVRRLSKCFVL